ncbi:phosphoribosylamine--glycine ligase [Candidatus Microgenomates bacterium]|nr:phosphoribosylamine--glycine ligase [Candidatus Microgenomates bacterium]
MPETLKKILIVGNGARESAYAWSLGKDPTVKIHYTEPGNADLSQSGTNAGIGIDDPRKLADYARENNIYLTVVGPEEPLAKGIVNEFNDRGQRIVGPTQSAARLETSKADARHALASWGIPGPDFATFSIYQNARDFLAAWERDGVVIKADGLCGGKGVFVCQTLEEAQNSLKRLMVDREFGSAGDRVVIEEKLEGREVSLIALTDGETIQPLIPMEDYKQVSDGDRGPNTGGMGVVAPFWEVISPEDLRPLTEQILRPIVQKAGANSGPYKGFIYAGLMMTKDGPKVLEINCRGGDPETQGALPLLQTPLIQAFDALVDGRLDKTPLRWSNEYCVGVVLTSSGYPGEYETGKEIFGLEEVAKKRDVVVFQAGTRNEDGKILTSGGRVALVAGLGSTPKIAANRAYRSIATTVEMRKGEVPEGKIFFVPMHYRTDIGQRGVSR